MKRNGAAGLHSIHWTSKYGSVVVSAFEAATVDGMNDQGLAANLLYLAESQYPKASAQDKRPTLCVSAWAQYVLDNYATVAEAVKALRREPLESLRCKRRTATRATSTSQYPIPAVIRPYSNTSVAN